jgi:hypothetical protein
LRRAVAEQLNEPKQRRRYHHEVVQMNSFSNRHANLLSFDNRL